MNQLKMQILLLLILGSFVIFGCTQTQNEEPLAIIAKIEKGSVLLKRASEQNFSTVQEKTRLFQGDIIKTPADSEVLIRFSSGAVTRISANTEFELKPPKIQQAGIKTYYSRLINGIATFYIPEGNEAAKKFEIETSMVIASIKGTVFKLAHQNEQTTVTVLQGKVRLQHRGPSFNRSSSHENVSSDKVDASFVTDSEIEVGEFQQVVVGKSGFSTPEQVNALMDKDLADVDKILKMSK